MFITACNERGNGPTNSQYAIYADTQKAPLPKLHGAIREGRHWVRVAVLTRESNDLSLPLYSTSVFHPRFHDTVIVTGIHIGIPWDRGTHGHVSSHLSLCSGTTRQYTQHSPLSTFRDIRERRLIHLERNRLCSFLSFVIVIDHKYEFVSLRLITPKNTAESSSHITIISEHIVDFQ